MAEHAVPDTRPSRPGSWAMLQLFEVPRQSNVHGFVRVSAKAYRAHEKTGAENRHLSSSSPASYAGVFCKFPLDCTPPAPYNPATGAKSRAAWG